MIPLKSQCIDFITDNNIATHKPQLPSELYGAISDTLHKKLLREIHLAIMSYYYNYPSKLKTCKICKLRVHPYNVYALKTFCRDKCVWEPYIICTRCFNNCGCSDITNCILCSEYYLSKDVFYSKRDYRSICIKCNIRLRTLEIEHLTDKKIMDFSMIEQCKECNSHLTRKGKLCLGCYNWKNNIRKLF